MRCINKTLSKNQHITNSTVAGHTQLHLLIEIQQSDYIRNTAIS